MPFLTKKNRERSPSNPLTTADKNTTVTSMVITTKLIGLVWLKKLAIIRIFSIFAVQVDKGQRFSTELS
jgi:hypothetical protein